MDRETSVARPTSCINRTAYELAALGSTVTGELDRVASDKAVGVVNGAEACTVGGDANGLASDEGQDAPD